MNKKNVYEIKPTLEIDSNYIIQIIENKMCLVDENKNRLMCVFVSDNDMMAMMLYFTYNIENRLIEVKEHIIKEIEKNYNKLDEEIKKASKSYVYRYEAEAYSDIETIIRRIENINNNIDDEIVRYNKVKYYIEKIRHIKNVILDLIEKNGYYVSQEIFML